MNTLPISVIIPTRGDRPLFQRLLNLNIHRCPADDIILVDYKPTDNTPDLLQRLQNGVAQAKYNLVAIMEDDDYYPPIYWKALYELSIMHPKNTAYGVKSFAYYHLRLNNYHVWHKHDNSALFCSMFTKNHLEKRLPQYVESTTHAPDMGIDNYLWSTIEPSQRLVIDFHYPPIGLKHGTGLCGGSGHKPNFYSQPDLCNAWLKKQLADDAEGLEAVMEIIENLKEQNTQFLGDPQGYSPNLH